LLDDLVQVLDFRVNDPGILRTRSLAETLNPAMIQQLHNRERIADFVGDLSSQQASAESFSFCRNCSSTSTTRSYSRAFSIAMADNSASALKMLISSLEKLYGQPI